MSEKKMYIYCWDDFSEPEIFNHSELIEAIERFVNNHGADYTSNRFNDKGNLRVYELGKRCEVVIPDTIITIK